MKNKAEIAILGAGFSGCLLAMVLKKIGKDVILIEQGKHPRFAVGESSTPLANLYWENICKTYGLTNLHPFSNFGDWQAYYPQIPCGLKRGFSFFKHYTGEPFPIYKDHRNELLVAASPADTFGDTHWFREFFDAFMVQQVQKADIPYYNHTEVLELKSGKIWQIGGKRQGESIKFQASFLIDATGAAGLLTRFFNIDTRPLQLRTCSHAIFSHFKNVRLWEGFLKESSAEMADYPFSCDDAALHHIFNDGWMWQLRFNNGITSAGFIRTSKNVSKNMPSGKIWATLCKRYPSIAAQFENAKPVQPFFQTGRLQRQAAVTSGKNWVMLPHTAYFIDPLLSAGNAHTLLGIERLADIFANNPSQAIFQSRLEKYNDILQVEIAFLDRLIHGCYCAFPHFELFAAFSMYYFTAAIWNENRRRNGAATAWDGFLSMDVAPIREMIYTAYKKLRTFSERKEIKPTEALAFQEKVAADIAPFNLAGLCDPARRNMYPFIEG